MADASAPKQPNRPLAMLLLIITTIGSIAMVSLGTWHLLDESRLTGFAWLSSGVLWFVFFSWIFRATLRPGPQG